MKRLLKGVVMLVFGIIILQGAVFAQHGRPGHGGELGGIVKESLTEEQKAALEANRIANQEMREAFKATLTEAQKAILDNAELNAKEKREAFRATLTEDQLGMLESQKAARKVQMEAFRASLTDEQKAMMKKAAMKRQKARAALLKKRAAGTSGSGS